MGNKIAVNLSTLSQDAQLIKEKVSKAKKEVDKLRRISDELNGMWEGDAKTVYVANLNNDENNLAELVQEAEKMANMISEALDIYKKCELEISNRINSMNV